MNNGNIYYVKSNSKYKERKGTWKMIMMLSLIVVLILILFLYNKDIFHRDTVITIVTNLPLGIFKDENMRSFKYTKCHKPLCTENMNDKL